jgi:hypothetical protein
MTKKKLIEALAPFPDDTEVCFDISNADQDFPINPVENVRMRPVVFSEGPESDEDVIAEEETIVLEA